MAQLALLVVAWLGVYPLAVGLLFELAVVVPLRVSPDLAPFIAVHHNWFLGLLYLQLYYQFGMYARACARGPAAAAE